MFAKNTKTRIINEAEVTIEDSISKTESEIEPENVKKAETIKEKSNTSVKWIQITKGMLLTANEFNVMLGEYAANAKIKTAEKNMIKNRYLGSDFLQLLDQHLLALKRSDEKGSFDVDMLDEKTTSNIHLNGKRIDEKYVYLFRADKYIPHRKNEDVVCDYSDDDLIKEFKAKMSTYLPLNFDYDSHIGIITWTEQANKYTPEFTELDIKEAFEAVDPKKHSLDLYEHIMDYLRSYNAK